MKTLEQEAKKGFELNIIPNSFGLSIGLLKNGSGQSWTSDSCYIQDALKFFEEEYFIKMPDVGSKPEFNKIINTFLDKGYRKPNTILGTVFYFKFDAKRKLYFSTLEVQNSAWIQYIKEHPNDSPFSRELTFGKSKKDFLNAYSDMERNFKRQSQPL